MSDVIKAIGAASDGRTVYRRQHSKSDGRNVFLYGYDRPDQDVVTEGLEAPASSSELRWHPLRQEWSVYAAARQNRTFKPSAAADPLAPSMPGGADTEIPFSAFEIAVFENRFPSFSRKQSGVGLSNVATPAKPATGNCEVIVYTDEAEGSLATLSLDRRELLVRAWIDRYAELFAKGCEFVLPFENRGDEVGVTLHHPHGQIYGFDFVPPVQAAATKGFDEGFDLAAALQGWRETFEICSSGPMSAFAPPFARYPYEVWIAPLARRRGPWEFSDEEVSGFSELLGGVTARLDRLFGRPCPYMLSLHSAPVSASTNFHFTTQIYPVLRAPDRLKYFASVEHSTGVYTVDVLPERAAAELRSA